MSNNTPSSNSSISGALGIQPMPVSLPQSLSINVEAEANTETDFNYARSNLYDVIEKGSHALEELIGVAKATQHPRAFEVVSTLIGTLVGANKELMDLNKRNIDIRNMDAAKGGKENTINNNLYVSANDLLDMIKKQKNE